MQANEIMNTDVKTVEPKSTVQDAARKMEEFGIGSLLAVKGGKLVGIVTERDLLNKVVAKAMDSSKLKVSDIMEREVIMIGPETDVEDACEIMVEKKVKKLPVIKDDGLIGIVTATDIVSAQPKLMEQLGKILLLPGKKKLIAG